jgi:hypothetical protein
VSTINNAVYKNTTQEEDETFLDTLKRLEAARKYMWWFHAENNIIAMCNKAENEMNKWLTGQLKQ